MKTSSRAGRVAAIPLTLILGSAAFAQPLSFSGTPAGDAVAQVDRQYGIQVVLKGQFNPATPVTFDVPEGPTSRLQAINALANALGADFQKSWVVSKAASGVTSAPKIDNADAPVYFRSTTVPVDEAIRTVAGVDDALITLPSNLTGTVTFSSTNLRNADAAAEIARQTHTQWKAFYAMVPRGQGRGANQSGTVIGRTNGGSPIVKLPGTTFQQPTPPPSQSDSQQANGANGTQNGQQANADGTQAGQQGDAAQQQAYAAQQQAYAAQQAYANGFGYGNGYNYGLDNPFGGSYYPIAPGLGYSPDPYQIYQTGPAYLNGVPYQTTVGGYSPGGFSLGGGAVNVLPSFPYGGGYGGPIIIGGY